MKILQLCSRVPYPPINGGSIAMLALTRALCAEGNDVYILSINTPKHHFDLQNLPDELLDIAQWDAVDIDTTVRPFAALMNLFTNQSYHIQRFYSKEFENKLIDLLLKEKFDIIQMESLFVTPYIKSIRKHTKAKIIYRAHNIEYKIWELVIEGLQAGLKRSYLHIQTYRLKSYETNMVNQFDAIVTITPEDKKLFESMGCNLPIHVSPIGVDDTDSNLPEHHNIVPVLFHLGSMNWVPNVEAVDWFIKEAWNELHKKYPALKFYIGGRGMPERLTRNNIQSLYVYDDVEDAKQWMNTKDIMIVPLLSGSGMRVKIIEGMALGKTIISTTIGAEGIDYTHLQNILIADTPSDFSQMIGLCFNDRELCTTISKNAKDFVMNQYHNKTIGEMLNHFYHSLLLN